MEKNLAERERIIADLTLAYAELSRELERVKARAEELGAEAAMARSLKERLEMIRSSTSWRATAPLRALKDSLLRRKTRTAPHVPEGDSRRVRREVDDGMECGETPQADARRISAQAENGNLAPGALCTVLVLDRLVPTPWADNQSARLLAIIKGMGALGASVAFGFHTAPADPEAGMDRPEESRSPHAPLLGKLGATTLLGCSAIEDHLRLCGRNFRHVLLASSEVMYEYLPLVRTCAPGAHVSYIPEKLRLMRLKRDSTPASEQDAKGRTDRHLRMERVNLRSADTVIALTEDEQDLILTLASEARVVLLPESPHLSTPAALREQPSVLFSPDTEDHADPEKTRGS